KYYINSLRFFSPSTLVSDKEFRFSRLSDLFSLLQGRKRGKDVRVHTAYKRKAQKVRPVDSDQSDGSKPGGELFWKQGMLEREKQSRTAEIWGQYSEQLIPKFSGIARGARLTPE